MSLQDSRTAALRDAIASWIAGHEDEIGSTQLRLSGISGTSLLLQANSKRVHLSVPSSAEEVFLVTAADPDPDPSFDAALLILNEKFERLRPEGDALFVAMEYLLTVLKKFQANTASQPSGSAQSAVDGSADDDGDDNDGGDEDDDVDEYMAADEVDYGYDMASLEDASTPSAFMELRHRGFLYAMAIEAKQQCEAARRKFQNIGAFSDAASMNTESALAWCIVNADPGALLIRIKMQVGGIMRDDIAAASLGLSLDLPVHICLEINKDLWCREQYSSSLKIDACHVKAVFDNDKDPQDEEASQKPNADASEGWDRDQRHKFGEEIFVPELVHCFFQYLERKDKTIAKSSAVLKELEEFTTMGNPIVGLIHFLATRLSALPNWCIACWDTLPYKVGRLRTCEKDLCLYRFEELGLGTTILQEVHKSCELMDFEISLAIAAASSNRDVFEPFPAFLLEKEEIRDRSGWFSKKLKPTSSPLSSPKVGFDCRQTGDHNENSNKSFCVLRSILAAYPSLEEMQCFINEVDFKKALARAWYKYLDAHKDEVHEQWRQKAWLPYDLLRFLISSNRLTLCCLKGHEQLGIESAIYQFAVLHNNPEKEAHFEKRRAEMGGSFFAFHGSPAGNWFSILRNGLRSLSNTRYMSTGAAYGAGIYIASHMATSLGYATKWTGWKHGRMRGSFIVLAICEIVNGSLVLQGHSHGIMVVRPECEQEILIRYILVLSGDPIDMRSCCSAIDQQCQLTGPGGMQTNLWVHHSHLRDMYYTKQENEWGELKKARWLSLSTMCRIEEEEERRLQTFLHAANPDSKSTHTQSSHAMPGCMQAIQKELKNISHQITLAKRRKLLKDANLSILAHIEIDVPDETSLQRWHVGLGQELFKESPLYKDLVRQAKQIGQPTTSVKLECVFPDTFPMAPPFIRIVSPRFRFHTGHITVGGSICMELLTESGWSPAFCFESVLVQIVSAMMEGGARLDFGSSNSEYSVQEARAAFDRVARDHGWIKGK